MKLNVKMHWTHVQDETNNKIQVIARNGQIEIYINVELKYYAHKSHCMWIKAFLIEPIASDGRIGNEPCKNLQEYLSASNNAATGNIVYHCTGRLEAEFNQV